jgi:hypothetical protein
VHTVEEATGGLDVALSVKDVMAGASLSRSLPLPPSPPLSFSLSLNLNLNLNLIRKNLHHEYDLLRGIGAFPSKIMLTAPMLQWLQCLEEESYP